MKLTSLVPTVVESLAPVATFRSYQMVWPSKLNVLGSVPQLSSWAKGMVCNASSLPLNLRPPIGSDDKPETFPISMLDLSWLASQPAKLTFAIPFPAVSSGRASPNTASVSVLFPVRLCPEVVGYKGPLLEDELFHLSLLFEIFMTCRKLPLVVIETV